MSVKKAVFPVAGFGTRFLPATKATPKEMLPIVDKPIVQYAVEEAYEAGIREFIFITHHAKRAIEDHFELDLNLRASLSAVEFKISIFAPERTLKRSIGEDFPMWRN